MSSNCSLSHLRVLRKVQARGFHSFTDISRKLEGTKEELVLSKLIMVFGNLFINLVYPELRRKMIILSLFFVYFLKRLLVSLSLMALKRLQVEYITKALFLFLSLSGHVIMMFEELWATTSMVQGVYI